MIDATPNDIPKSETKTGRFLSGTKGCSIITPPEVMKADPKPAIALPKINTMAVGADPQRAEPTSKTKIESRNVLFVANS